MLKIKSGIMLKLFIWYLILMSIFYATIFILFIHIQDILRASESIVNRNYKVAASSKKMIDSLLWMEENESKYDLLKKEDYRAYFIAAQKDYEANLLEILRIGFGEDAGGTPWSDLYNSYTATFQPRGDAAESPDDESAKKPWVSEQVLNEWIRQISKARTENDQAIENSMRSVTTYGKVAVRWGFIGLAASVAVGLLGSFFLAISMNRPLKELRRGIRSVSKDGISEPIRIRSKDEFGELAAAFNDMTARLREEERMRSDFISMLSHEIRTPLTSVRESVNLISEELMGPVTERQKRFLDIASSEMERITRLLNNLLQVSRLEAGAVNIRPLPLDPSDFIAGTIRRASPAAEARGITISANIGEHPPMIMGDRDNLQQVLLNLLGNAIKFSPPGSEVLVQVEPDTESPQGKVRISVSDCGDGIPEEEMQLVFHKYYRASGVRNQVDGVGLGLSISKLIVEAHGGTVGVQARAGGGCTFSFTLPAAQGGH